VWRIAKEAEIPSSSFMVPKAQNYANIDEGMFIPHPQEVLKNDAPGSPECPEVRLWRDT
jgi:hypothetical protein